MPLGQAGPERPPAGVRGRAAWAYAILAIVAYAPVIVVFPAGSLPPLIVGNVGSAQAATLAVGPSILAARRQTDPLTRAIKLLYPLASLTTFFLLTMLMLRSAAPA